jgi:hypothetical protein
MAASSAAEEYDVESVEEFLAAEWLKMDGLGRHPRPLDPAPILDALAKWLPRQGMRNESYTTQVNLQSPGRRTLTAVLHVLNTKSEDVLAGPPVPVEVPCLAAFVLSGLLNLNRTALVVHMVAVDANSSTLVISGVAREGQSHNTRHEKLWNGW